MTLPSLSDKKGWLRLLMFSNMGSIRAYYTIAKKGEILYSDDLFCLPRNILFLQLLDLLSHLSVLNWVFFGEMMGGGKSAIIVFIQCLQPNPTCYEAMEQTGSCLLSEKMWAAKNHLSPIHPSIHPPMRRLSSADLFFFYVKRISWLSQWAKDFLLQSSSDKREKEIQDGRLVKLKLLWLRE